MNKTIALCMLVSVMFVAGCADPSGEEPAAVAQPAPQSTIDAQPKDTVLDADSMEIYAMVVNNNEPERRGKYIYWIRDKSNQGWTLYSDKQYSVGDTLTIGPTTVPSTNIFGE